MNKITNVRINGGTPLHGEVTIASNKNAILPALAASILTDETMTYIKPPMSPDVQKMIQALDYMGATVEVSSDVIHINCKSLNTFEVPEKYVSDIQAGYLLAGPLLTRFGEAIIPMSSGCRLGYRGYEDHAEYFKKLGVAFTITENKIHFKLLESIKEERIVAHGLDYPQRYITYNNPCVTPSENIIMLLAGTSKFDTEVSGIAQEPHVAQLISLMKDMGASVKGKGSTVKILGANKLKGTIFTAEADHVDYFGFAVMAAMTKSDLLLRVPTPLSHGISHMNEFLEEMGVQMKIQNTGVLIMGSASSFSPKETFPKADIGVYKMNVGPWPIFPVDCLPSFIAFSTMNADPATTTRSTNWMYTDGLKYIANLKEMGAKVQSSDDQRVVTQGTPTGAPYTGKTVVTAPDVIEGARAVISCALTGGQHTVQNAQYILRRNPDFFTILKGLGADIEITELE